MDLMLGKNKKSTKDKDDGKIELWVEKYRPKNMDEVSSQEEVVKVLRKTMETKNLPHLLFYGPPGTGKTSTILALARELYGPELMKSRVLELNASDDRGIDVIREKVKNFSRLAVSQNTNGNSSCPPYKIVILDEADSMTNDAQTALRRTMEISSKVTRFCLICNYVSRIIDPLTSRCAKFRFKSLGKESMKSRLEEICKCENIPYTDEALNELINVSEGDMRKSITYLQSASQLSKIEGSLTPNMVFELAGVIPNEIVDQVINVWVKGTSDEKMTMANNIILSGYSVSKLLLQINKRLVENVEFSSKIKCYMVKYLGKAEKALVEGADEKLQLLSLLYSEIHS
ncbi:P-loop containing nucleoside triphosphate hydrolase protein [Anaeromyces robustus]|uniref:p-loop containing nucleoside triphosphate hydrolase protein n=1 Tax=Anaeromyces robustus TaxID=1754192 RepID=A0A1Y1XHG6_9FUNG|nr:P-loop containing nucleoside triphosphate hydrolase protein [Anaeromyces robustus]|eukprot:ORX85180.1 P-loop containing nucleoside triphosphate hydrolase protein [Anaeromyces robustus]